VQKIRYIIVTMFEGKPAIVGQKMEIDKSEIPALLAEERKSLDLLYEYLEKGIPASNESLSIDAWKRTYEQRIEITKRTIAELEERLKN